MDWTALSQALVSAETPALPGPVLLRVALHVTWAVVLAWVGMLVGGRLPRPYRLALAVSLLVWTLMPGPVSPAFWLGLAFQTPSLMTLVICLGWLYALARPVTHRGPVLNPSHLRALKGAGLVGVLLGWLLLLDTFALFPFSLYSAGFSAAGPGAAALLLSLPWIVAGARPGWGTVCAAGWLVLALFVVARLPTGNLWDALIDPWLWLALQAGWLRWGVRRLIGAWRGSPATHA